MWPSSGAAWLLQSPLLILWMHARPSKADCRTQQRRLSRISDCFPGSATCDRIHVDIYDEARHWAIVMALPSRVADFLSGMRSPSIFFPCLPFEFAGLENVSTSEIQYYFGKILS